MTKDLLLQLYDHTLEVRLWDSREKLAPRARFDRPLAFRLPAPTSEETGGEEPRCDGRLDKFPLVRQQMEQVGSTQGARKRGKVRKKASSLSSVSEEELDLDLSTSIGEVSPCKKIKLEMFCSLAEVTHSPTKEATSLDHVDEEDLPTDRSQPKVTTGDDSEPLPMDQNQSGPKADESGHEEMLESVVLHHTSIFTLHGIHTVVVACGPLVNNSSRFSQHVAEQVASNGS